jgi:hypothetical protein
VSPLLVAGLVFLWGDGRERSSPVGGCLTGSRVLSLALDRTKVSSSDPPLTTVCTAYTTPPFLPFIEEAAPRREDGCGTWPVITFSDTKELTATDRRSCSNFGSDTGGS